ncbi:replication initiation factor domain-containing protein [Bremerella alba]|uniref:Replication initiation factor n=1 Tax=Bremerella alba TaxID=980252 RepID=A0A7V8V1C8_9BACT|nr:replication initiation factor domain-containing protein [Bremerella alba]MBA2113074.1 hypothetical protein [Bremerella alba]
MKKEAASLVGEQSTTVNTDLASDQLEEFTWDPSLDSAAVSLTGWEGPPALGGGAHPVKSSNADEVDSEGMEVLECPEAFATAFANNMAVGNHQMTNNQDRKLKGGIDTVELAYVIQWREGTEQRRKLLQRCQDNAKAQDHNGAFFRLGEVVFKVFPNGAGRGKGVFRHYIMEGAGIHVEISKCSASHDQYFNARVCVGSVTCNLLPPRELQRRIHLVFDAFGGDILTETVSRVDLFIDDPHTTIEQVVSAWVNNQIITRAREFRLIGKTTAAQTFQVGSTNLLRAYNKLAELKAKPNQQKEEIIRNNFGGQLPETLTRFEFQLRRRFLRKWQIESFSDLIDNMNSLGHYLTNEWLRIAEEPVDRRHSDRARPAEWWQKIAAAFETIGEVQRKTLTSVTTRVRHAPSLIRQAVGCLLKALHPNCTSAAGFLAEIHERVRKEISDMGISEFDARLSKCHAEGQLATVDVALSGLPAKVSAESILARLRRMRKSEREIREERSEFLSGFVNDVPFVSWNDDEPEQSGPEDIIF